MKILVYSHTSSFYGAPQSMMQLTNELQTDNEIIYVLPSHGVLEDELQKRGYDVKIEYHPQWVSVKRALDYSRWFYFKHRVKEFLGFFPCFHKAYSKHIKLVREISPDLIIINTSAAPMGLVVAKRLNIFSVLWIREPLCNKVGWIIPTIFGKRLIARKLDIANVILGPSRYIKKYIENTFHISRIKDLPNAIDFIPKRYGEGLYLFGLVGSISERKGQLSFINSMREKMPQASVIVYGDGNRDYFKKLEEVAKEHPENINLYGYETDLDKIYSSFDIYVNMGIDETFGRTTIEAMRAGKLVFGRNSGATPELIRHGENGFLFDDPNEVFEILQKYNTESGAEKLLSIKKQGQKDSMRYMPENISKEFRLLLKAEDKNL